MLFVELWYVFSSYYFFEGVFWRREKKTTQFKERVDFNNCPLRKYHACEMKSYIWIFFQISIAFFNFAGISVTKEMSATTRMVLDSVRTLVIWTVSLLPFVKWQEFHALQLVGFIVLVTGMCIYNNIIFGKYIQTTLNLDIANKSVRPFLFTISNNSLYQM